MLDQIDRPVLILALSVSVLIRLGGAGILGRAIVLGLRRQMDSRDMAIQFLIGGALWNCGLIGLLVVWFFAAIVWLVRKLAEP